MVRDMDRYVFMNLLTITQNTQVIIRMELNKDGALHGSKMVILMKAIGTKAVCTE
jgi:hypothetical protein